MSTTPNFLQRAYSTIKSGNTPVAQQNTIAFDTATFTISNDSVDGYTKVVGVQGISGSVSSGEIVYANGTNSITGSAYAKIGASGGGGSPGAGSTELIIDGSGAGDGEGAINIHPTSGIGYGASISLDNNGLSGSNTLWAMTNGNSNTGVFQNFLQFYQGAPLNNIPLMISHSNNVLVGMTAYGDIGGKLQVGDGYLVLKGTASAIKFNDGTIQTTAASSGISGSIANTQLAFGSGTNAISGSSNLTYASQKLTLDGYLDVETGGGGKLKLDDTNKFIASYGNNELQITNSGLFTVGGLSTDGTDWSFNSGQQFDYSGGFNFASNDGSPVSIIGAPLQIDGYKIDLSGGATAGQVLGYTGVSFQAETLNVYSIIQNNGTSLTQRNTLNLSSRLLGSDVSSKTFLDLATSGATAGSYTNPSITIDAYGRTTSISSTTALVANSLDSTGVLSIAPSTATSLALGHSGINILIPGGIIRAATPSAGQAAVSMQFGIANGAAAGGSGIPATAGGQALVAGGTGGAGDGYNAPAIGGALLLQSGASGATGSFGSGNNSGAITMNIPAGTGTGTYGQFNWQFNGVNKLVYNSGGTLAPATTLGGQLGNSSNVWNGVYTNGMNTGSIDTITAGSLTIGNSVATAITIGHSGITTTITGALSQTTGAVSLTGNTTSAFTTTSGNNSIDAYGALNLGTSTATSVVIGSSNVITYLSGSSTSGSGSTRTLNNFYVQNTAAASSGTTLVNSKNLYWQGAYYNGTASTAYYALIDLQMTSTAPAGYIQFSLGTPSPSEVAKITNTGLVGVLPGGGLDVSSAGALNIGATTATSIVIGQATRTGNTYTNHEFGSGSAPTINVAGTPAQLGTGPAVSIFGTDRDGYMIITTGTTPSAFTSGTPVSLVTISFNTSYTTIPKSIILTAADQNASKASLPNSTTNGIDFFIPMSLNAVGTFTVQAVSLTGIVGLTVGQLAASTAYYFYYQVLG